ncbi:MAG: LLM class flavin-dependent oxidoreductase [Novosphingobium sp.]|nr:LLM class flavin-dependent oxidoreductase [Novosphingobium sp.]MCP5402162.1 LLM class flavin-dependent oxidoreductase [Novosphingobium sp.]
MKYNPISLAFDMRAPDLGTPTQELYAAAIEMAAWADEIGLNGINLMQHHGSDDGYLPQPFTLAAAMAAATKNIRFMLGAVILPLHDPVEIAEQIAVVDLISDGRLHVIFGAGYVPSEFAMFGKSVKDRARLMDEGLEIILRALNGERFEFNGRPVFVRPLPVQKPEEIVLVGGGVPASARRAARFDVGFGPMSGELVDVYLEECEKHGREPRRFFRPAQGMPIGIHLCEDPDEGWAVLEKHAVHVITEYAKWAEQEGDASNSPFRGLDDPAVLRHSGLFATWTPDQLVEKVRALPDHASVSFQPLLGGLSPREGWKSLKLLEQTLPRLREAMAEAV